ncbi:MAG: GNAT family N-acetyltransferase [Desulfurococcales archaeon]|nr:GNAT family N-acetyltransferase [Desulfurococcales archaeon]
MAARIIVREAHEGDEAQVARLIARLKALNEELDPHYKVVENLEEVSLEYARNAIRASDMRVIVAEDTATGEIVGVLVYRLVDRVFYKPKLKAQIVDFYVVPRYRGRRIGTLLIEKAEEMARRDGAGMLTVIYPSMNAIAERFYSSKGFIDLAVEKYKKIL